MPIHHRHRDPRTPVDQACVFAADFASECKRVGDMLNYYRWKMVLGDLVKIQRAQAQLSLFSDNGTVPP